ncbi:MAG: UDP-N-acetylmuramoyl-L-alanine--D-glutamate ligase [Clostridia bacterium]|nr:UDP-N-acetylmuramoyl-L-alanine--D-glutamate ligase [Clostridia bacterium]
MKAEDFKGKKILVVGMARSGISATHLMCRLGAEVTINDMKTREEMGDKLEELSDLPIEWRLGEDPDTLTDGKDMVLFTSAVPFWSEWIKRARDNGVPCYNEMEIGAQLSKAPMVAITGSNGKTTTTTLIDEIFRAAGRQSFAVGNIGIPLCNHALEMKEEGVMVVEAAPFQMISAPSFHPRVSMVLNITEDHLNWFKTMENYINQKCLVFKNQRGDDVCILNEDDPISSSLGDRPQCRVLRFSRTKQVEGAVVENDVLTLSYDGKRVPIINIHEIRIPGAHNLENALAAALSTHLMGVAPEVIAQTLRDFAGVEHRIETVGTVDGITYINDSKATNPDSTIKAVQAMRKPTVLILGGSVKNSDYLPMFKAFTPEIERIVVLGATAQAIMDTAERAGFKNVHYCPGTFEEAVALARSVARPGMNVLLSPACASYDMFESYEHRGRTFKRLVKEMENQ